MSDGHSLVCGYVATGENDPCSGCNEGQFGIRACEVCGATICNTCSPKHQCSKSAFGHLLAGEGSEADKQIFQQVPQLRYRWPNYQPRSSRGRKKLCNEIRRQSDRFDRKRRQILWQLYKKAGLPVPTDVMGMYSHWLAGEVATAFIRSKLRERSVASMIVPALPMIEVTYEDEDEAEVTASLPAKRVPCPRCPDGTVDCFEGGVTDDMREDPDFDEDYAAGRYSKECPECHGTRTVLEVDEARLTPEEQEVFEQYTNHQRMLAEIRAEERYERRNGC